MLAEQIVRVQSHTWKRLKPHCSAMQSLDNVHININNKHHCIQLELFQELLRYFLGNILSITIVDLSAKLSLENILRVSIWIPSFRLGCVCLEDSRAPKTLAT